MMTTESVHLSSTEYSFFYLPFLVCIFPKQKTALLLDRIFRSLKFFRVDFLVLRLFQADLHQPLPWQLGSSLIQRKDRKSTLLSGCFCLPIHIRLLFLKELMSFLVS